MTRTLGGDNFATIGRSGGLENAARSMNLSCGFAEQRGSNPSSSATKPQALLDLETTANLSGEHSLYRSLYQTELPA